MTDRDREGERTFVGGGGSRPGTASALLDEDRGGGEFDPEVYQPEPPVPVAPRRPSRTAPNRADDQSELYPAVGPGNAGARRVALPVPLLIFIMAVIFLAGVLLAEML